MEKCLSAFQITLSQPPIRLRRLPHVIRKVEKGQGHLQSPAAPRPALIRASNGYRVADQCRTVPPWPGARTPAVSSSGHCLAVAGFSQPTGWVIRPAFPGRRSLRGPAGHGPGGWEGTRRGSTHRTMEGPATVGHPWGSSDRGDADRCDRVGTTGDRGCSRPVMEELPSMRSTTEPAWTRDTEGAPRIDPLRLSRHPLRWVAPAKAQADRTSALHLTEVVGGRS